MILKDNVMIIFDFEKNQIEYSLTFPFLTNEELAGAIMIVQNLSNPMLYSLVLNCSKSIKFFSVLFIN